MGSNWALPSCCCGEWGKWGFVCHLYSPGFLTWLSKRKRARDFLLWFLLSPAIVKGLWELKKSIKIPVRTEPGEKEGLWLWCSWWSLFFGLTATWDWPQSHLGGIQQLFARKELLQVHRTQLQSWHFAKTLDLLLTKCRGISHSHRSRLSPFGWHTRRVLLGKYGCRNKLPGV